jgi:hypothetical protein
VRYADEHTQRQFEVLQRKGGRPTNSPGWGMLVACKTGAYVSERNPADRADITAGSTRVSCDYWLVREHPELFKPADNRDARTFHELDASLERKREDLERGLPAARRVRTARPGTLTLPGQPFRLPNGNKPFRLPRPSHHRVLP